MAKRDEGKKYKEELLKLVAEDKRSLVAEALGEAVEEHLGEHVLMRSDYSKNMDQVREAASKVNAYNQSLTDWYTQNQEALAETARLKEKVALMEAMGGNANNPAPADDETASLKKITENFIPRAEAQKLLQGALSQQANELLTYTNSLNKISMQHSRNFDEILDTDAVVKHALQTKKPLDAAYGDLFKDRYAEKAAKQEAERDKKKEQELRTKIEEEFRAKNPTLPYAVSNSLDGGLSPILEAMKSKDVKSAGVAEAVDEFYRMQRPQ